MNKGPGSFNWLKQLPCKQPFLVRVQVGAP